MALLTSKSTVVLLPILRPAPAHPPPPSSAFRSAVALRHAVSLPNHSLEFRLAPALAWQLLLLAPSLHRLQATTSGLQHTIQQAWLTVALNPPPVATLARLCSSRAFRR